jgi:DNA-binding GntR family transcriptional regulator
MPPSRKPAEPPDAARLGDTYSPLRDLVTQSIRQAIVRGRYRPGERLIEERIAAELGVSRNPVREAIRALASEGFIEVTPRRSAVVASLSNADAWEMVEVRATLEGLNARLAARRHKAGVIDRIKSALSEGRGKATTGTPEEFVEFNNRFHDLLAEAGNNRVLGDIMRTLRERTAHLFAPRSLKQAETNWEEHADILEAIIAGDEELAALLASRHVLHAGRTFLAEREPAPEETTAAPPGMKAAAGGKR